MTLSEMVWISNKKNIHLQYTWRFLFPHQLYLFYVWASLCKSIKNLEFYIQTHIFQEKDELTTTNKQTKKNPAVEVCQKKDYSHFLKILVINQIIVNVYLDTLVTIMHLISSNLPLRIWLLCFSVIMSALET